MNAKVPDTTKPKRVRFVTPHDNAVRTLKKIEELKARRQASQVAHETKTRQLWDEQNKLIDSLPAEEQEILFRLEPGLRPSAPVEVTPG